MKWQNLLVFSLCWLTIGCQAQDKDKKDKKVSQQDSTTKEEIVDFSNFTIKEVLSVIYKSGLQEVVKPGLQTRQNIFFNPFIDFTKYNIVEEFVKEVNNKYLEKVVILQTEKVVNNIEIRFYYSGSKTLSVIKIGVTHQRQMF